MVLIEDERLMLMLRYFSICFHIPLSNREVSTNGYQGSHLPGLLRVFYPQNLPCTPKIDGSLYMLLYIGGTKIGEKY